MHSVLLSTELHQLHTNEAETKYTVLSKWYGTIALAGCEGRDQFFLAYIGEVSDTLERTIVRRSIANPLFVLSIPRVNQDQYGGRGGGGGRHVAVLKPLLDY